MILTFEQVKAFVEAEETLEVTTYLKRGDDPLGDYLPPSNWVLGSRTIPVVGRIRIFSEDGSMGLHELITLAHEYGHHLRMKNGEREPGYKEMIDLRVCDWLARPKVEREKVYREEAAAWVYAESTLRELSFEDWSAFEADRDLSLADYRQKLAVE